MRKLHWFLKIVLIVMAIGLFWIGVTVLLPKILPTKVVSNSELSGVILENQIWKGTIHINGDLIAAYGTTITITPGTTILINIKDDKFNFDFLPWHLKTGINTGKYERGIYPGEPFWDERQKVHMILSKVIAIGSKGLPITIKSNSASASPYDVNSISIRSGVLSYVKFSNYRRLEIGSDVIIRDSEFKEIGECAICIRGGQPTIINNVFENILREAIWVNGASPRITDNQFTNLVGEGIKVNPMLVGAPVISHNSFEMPETIALNILGGGEIKDVGVISLNNFSGNSMIVLPCDSRVKIRENSLLGRISFASPGCNGEYKFEANFWGTEDVKTILAERILNKGAGFKIKILNVLKSPPKGVGRRI